MTQLEPLPEHVENMFQLVLVAAKRARQLANGAEAMVEWENDKPTVVALREIAEEYITESILEERDQPIEELLDLETAAADLQDDLMRSRPITIGG